MKITRARERLADYPGAHDRAIFFDQLSVGSTGKQDLSQTCDGKRIEHSEDNRRNQSKP
jgi:hypothetical protein